MMTENIIDGVDVSGLSCSECPENEKKRCLEQQERYKNEIYYFLSLLENADTKGQIEVLKTKISYPTRCDVVLEKQLKRKEAELKKLQDYIKEDLIPHTQIYIKALEEIREIVNEPCIEEEDCETCDANCMSKEIIDKINEVLK